MATTSHEIIIRPRSPSDIPILLEILPRVHTLQNYPVDGPSAFESKLHPPTFLSAFVAVYNSQVVGHIITQPASGTSLDPAVIKELGTRGPLHEFAALGSLFIDPDFQGKSIGTRLIEEAIQSAKREGRRMVLDVLEEKGAAIRLYERLGWVRWLEYVHVGKTGREYPAFSYMAPE